MPTPKARRGRPSLGDRARARTSFTLSPEAVKALEALARRRGISSSRQVEELILARPLTAASVWERVSVPKTRLAGFLRKHGVERAWFFGSILRGDFSRDSDIDLLVRLEKGRKMSLFDFADLKLELEALLGRRVDLVEEAAITNPILRDEVMKTREEIDVPR